MLAHELRNPLAPIAAGAELLKRVSADAEQVRKTSDVIARQVHHMTGLVDDLLDVSRVTRGQVVLDLQGLDIQQVVRDSIEQTRPLMTAREHRLTFDAPAAKVSVRADGKRLVQTFVNLLNNAAKYTPKGGRIVITVEVATDSVSVCITDNGQGMSRELLSHCFDLFAQGERTAERSGGGLGIGLALVRSLVTMHGGSVTADSQGAGKGSQLKVTLPRVMTAHVDSTAVPSHQEPIPVHSDRLSVLVVDDNEDAAHVLAMLVGALGHDAVVEHHPRAVLTRIELTRPDICLMDIGLPEMNGYELATAIQARFGERTPRLVAITGYGQPQDRAKALASGFDEHFSKPIDFDKLTELLQRKAEST